MRVLITQRELVTSNGSEMVTIETGKALAERGLSVAVYSPVTGEAAKMLLATGVRTVSRLDDVPWQPDVIHGHHHLPAMAAIARFPAAPAIYHCHGTKPWVEQPPVHERIHRYVMMCEWMVRRAATEFGFSPERVTCLPNFVNTARFSEVRTPPAQLRRAVLFGGNGLPGEEMSRLEAACAAVGLSLDTIGWAYGNQRPRPEIFLQDYDLVFAIGKCALEAMASGCAVMTLITGQAGGLITSATFDDWAFMNFGPRYFAASTQINEDWLRAQLASYSPADAAMVTARVRRDHSLDCAMDRLQAIHRSAVEAAPAAEPSPIAFAAYLERLASEVDRMWCDLNALRSLPEVAQDLKARVATLQHRQNELQEELLSLYRAQAADARTREQARSAPSLWHRITALIARPAN